MREHLRAWRPRAGKRGCRWCAYNPAPLLGLVWCGRRRCVPRGLLCSVAGLLGIAGLVLFFKRHRRPDRFGHPGEPDPGERPTPVRQRVPSTIYRRPDPLIYSQGYLTAQGLAVTWDNPDIHIEQNGTPVSSHALEPSTDYEIVARVWNGSTNAPAIGMPVRFSYLEFGIGTVSHALGERHVDLPVKGAPGLPATARMPWTTPAAAGHYCLQVELMWPDDANPANNLGQENTDVKTLNSPHAAFAVPIRNDGPLRRRLALEVDAYRIPPRRPCPPEDDHGTGPREREERRRRARALHARGGHPVSEGWTVAVQPEHVTLAAGEQTEVSVAVTAPDGFEGRQTFNLNALAGEQLAGGVTLTVEGKA